MKFYRLISLAVIPILILSCQKSLDDISINVPPVTILNVSYGTDPLQNMDVYLPANRTTTATKVLIMIHGGAWIGGDKTDFAANLDTFRKRLPDYAFFNINYRLSAIPNNLFPAQENDVKAAVQFIYSKASEYLISNKYVLLGVKCRCTFSHASGL